jgi:hypothetical protein
LDEQRTSQRRKMANSELNLLRRSFLRYWARNLKLARSMPGFDYSSVEWRRLDTIARDVTPWGVRHLADHGRGHLCLPGPAADLPHLVWTDALWYPGKITVPMPFVVGALASMIVFAVVGLPAAMAVAGLTIDRLFRLQPLEEFEGDVALFRKIRSQIVRVAAVAIAGVGLLELIGYLGR